MSNTPNRRRHGKDPERRRAELEYELNGLLSRRQALARGGLGLAALAGLPTLLAACGGDDGDGGSQPTGSKTSTTWTPEKVRAEYGSTTIGDSWHSLQLAIIADRARGGELAAKALGQKYKGYSADLDPVKQLSGIANAMNSGIEAINTVPMEAPSVDSISRDAKRSDVLFTTAYNSPAWKTPVEYGPQYISYLAPNDREAGKMMATNLFEHLGGKGKVVHLQGLAGATADIQRTLGVDDALEEFPNIELVAREPTNWSAVDSQKKMENLLSNLDAVDGVIGQNDDIGIGAYNAIRVRGKEIPVVGMDGTEEVYNLINESFFLGSVNTFTHYVGGFSFVRLFDAMHGWKPEPAETMMYWPIAWVDKSKAGDLIKAFYGSTLPYDFTKMSRVLHPDDWDTQQLLTPMDPNVLWQEEKKPAGYELPAGYDEASREKIAKLYDEHWVTRDFT